MNIRRIIDMIYSMVDMSASLPEKVQIRISTVELSKLLNDQEKDYFICKKLKEAGAPVQMIQGKMAPSQGVVTKQCDCKTDRRHVLYTWHSEPLDFEA